VEFVTVYPGWIEGRAPHIDFRVRLSANRTIASQMYFPQDITEAIYRRPEYRAPGAGYVSNESDPVLQATAPDSRRVLRAGVFVYMDGFMSELVVGVDPR
jgi:protocatechuate 3,4-dioxygenase beta subunit